MTKDGEIVFEGGKPVLIDANGAANITTDEEALKVYGPFVGECRIVSNVSLPEPLMLPMGEPNQCYDNSMRAVWARPDRLKYAEGFEITEYDNGVTVFNHHAQVLDTATGMLHEVTPHHDRERNRKFIYRSFWRHELGVCGPTDDPTMMLYWPGCDYDPAECYTQLTLKAQHTLLIESGYKVELWAIRKCLCFIVNDICLCGLEALVASGKAKQEERLVDMATEDMTLCRYFKEPADGESYDEVNAGWFYQWRVAAKVAAAAA